MNSYSSMLEPFIYDTSSIQDRLYQRENMPTDKSQEKPACSPGKANQNNPQGWSNL